MKRIIMPVGTSIFTNLPSRIRDCFKEEYGYLSGEDRKKPAVLASKFDEEKEKVATIREEVIKKFNADSKETSAETFSIDKIVAELKEEMQVYLLATDTVLSRLACELLKTWLEKYRPQIHVEFDASSQVIQNLSVDNAILFKKGLIKLITWLDSVIPQGNSSERFESDCIFNITGGYKALIPYFSVFGQIRNIPIYYIFEESNDLIKIPRTAISLDWRFISDNAEHFRKLDDIVTLSETQSWEEYKSMQNIPDVMDDYCEEIKDNGGKLVSLNALGMFIWREQAKYFFVEMPHKCKYFSEKQKKNKKIVADAIAELKNRIDNKRKESNFNFDDWKDDDVKHISLRNKTFIYKQPNPQQVRIHYSYNQTDNSLKVYNFYFVKSEKDDKHYADWMREDFKDLESAPTTLIGFQKKA